MLTIKISKQAETNQHTIRIYNNSDKLILKRILQDMPAYEIAELIPILLKAEYQCYKLLK